MNLHITVYLLVVCILTEQEVDHTFEELLVFITGADLLPPLGSCNIDFYDQESGIRIDVQLIPVSSETCCIRGSI